VRTTNMSVVTGSVNNLNRGASRGQRLSRAIRACRHLTSPRGGGRAWINGREVGGQDPRYAYLAVTHD
jgi:hypothetical protein